MSKMLVHSAADRVGVSACGLRGLASKRISTVASKITCRRCRRMRGLPVPEKSKRVTPATAAPPVCGEVQAQVQGVKPLSMRVRPEVEAAPWVVDEIRKLEQQIADLRERAVSVELQNVYAAFYATERAEAALALYRAGRIVPRDPYNRAGTIAMQLRNQRGRPSDDELRKLWREAGGEFHGPNVETGAMPEALLLPFLFLLLQL